MAAQSKNVSGQQDLASFARILPLPPNPQRIPRKIFAPPQPPQQEGEEQSEYNVSGLALLASFETEI